MFFAVLHDVVFRQMHVAITSIKKVKMLSIVSLITFYVSGKEMFCLSEEQKSIARPSFLVIIKCIFVQCSKTEVYRVILTHLWRQ